MRDTLGNCDRLSSVCLPFPHYLLEEALTNIDCDYIKRCLGDLSPLQESRLVQLKKWVSQLQKGKVWS